ncbi:MAG: succinate dehydrogenase, cytochrome b556 subunit [Lautropia sp.]
MLKYRLPTAGIVSILHRISGALLFLVGIPFVLYLFQKSITSELSFITYRNVVGSIPGKLVLIVLVWAFLHHLIAGFRYLALDLHIGIEKDRAAFSSKIVLAATGALTLICAIGLLFL